jgi:hypothetical protein
MIHDLLQEPVAFNPFPPILHAKNMSIYYMLDLSWSYLGPHIEPLPFKGRDCLPGQVARCLTGSCPLNVLILWILVIFVWHLQCFVLGVLQRSCPFRSVHEERRAMRSMGNDGGAPMVTIWVPCYHASFQKWHDQKQNEASMPRMPRWELIWELVRKLAA